MQRHPRIRDETYLSFVRKQPCCVCGNWPVDAAHIRMASLTVYGKPATGMAEKPDDRWCVPLCRVVPGVRAGCHKNQHSMGEASYWEAVGLNPFEIAIKLYAQGGDPERKQNKPRKRQTIQSRGFPKVKRKFGQ